MSNRQIKILIIVGAVLVCFAIFFGATPGGRAIWNEYFFGVQKADDSTNYQTRKVVEDTCRSMISSYTSDKLTYEQYKDSEDSDKVNWAEQAKIRANRTAASYNNYILENEFIWEGNVPSDIYMELEYIE